MFSTGQTYFLYNFVMLLGFALCLYSDIVKNKRGVILAYFIILLLSVFRYDIGADYERYVSVVHGNLMALRVHNWDGLLGREITLALFSFLCQWAERPETWVFALYSIVTLVFIYAAFEHYHCHTWGLLLFIMSYLLFICWDGIRQGVAIAIFLYSVRFIEEKKPVNFLLLIFFACTFHKSAVFLLFLYPVRYINIRPYLLAGVLFIMLILAELNFFTHVHEAITRMIPLYSVIYSGTGYTQNGAGTYHSTTYILTVLTYILTLLVSRPKYKTFNNLFFLGVVVYIIAGGNLNFLRVSWYLASVEILLLSFLFQEYKSSRKHYLSLGIVLFLHFLIFNGVFLKSSAHGVVPYETIFSEEYDYRFYRFRTE